MRHVRAVPGIGLGAGGGSRGGRVLQLLVVSAWEAAGEGGAAKRRTAAHLISNRLLPPGSPRVPGTATSATASSSSDASVVARRRAAIGAAAQRPAAAAAGARSDARFSARRRANRLRTVQGAHAAPAAHWSCAGACLAPLEVGLGLLRSCSEAVRARRRLPGLDRAVETNRESSKAMYSLVKQRGLKARPVGSQAVSATNGRSAPCAWPVGQFQRHHCAYPIRLRLPYRPLPAPAHQRSRPAPLATRSRILLRHAAA